MHGREPSISLVEIITANRNFQIEFYLRLTIQDRAARIAAAHLYGDSLNFQDCRLPSPITLP